MKRILLVLLACTFTTITNAQIDCSNGTAGGFDCLGMTLQAQLTIAQMGGQSYGSNDPAEAQDSWGWTDSTTDKEYALVGMNDRTAFVDISNPVAPLFLGHLPSKTGTSWWRDIKVYNNHAYIVSDNNGNHGMQIFDLTRLRNVNNPPVTFTEDGWETWGSGNPANKGIAHNIIINEDTGYAYLVGTGGYANAGVVIFNLSNATNPSEVATISNYGRAHDAQVITYIGPDTEHLGKEIMVGSFDGSDFVHVLDVTTKSNIINISSFDYSNKSVTHQGWFTEDQRFFIVGDEGDELGGVGNTRTLVYDMTNLDNPVLHYTHSGATAAIDHNGYVKGNRFYLANYRAGLRVFKFEDLYDPAITTNQMTEVEFFDTHPGSNSAAFHGAWNVYPFFESGNIIVSDLDEGLIIVRDPNYDTTPPVAVCQAYTAVLDKATGTVTLDPLDVDGGSSDNVGIIKRTLTGQTTFTCADVGATFSIELTVEDDYGFSDSCVVMVTVAGEDTVYQGGGTWSNGLPGIGSNAKISTNDYDTAASGNNSFSACTCEIDAGRTLTVGPDDHILIERDIVVDGSLIVNHTGNVVQVDPSASVIKEPIAGVINVEITTPVLQTRDFMVLGSPMDEETRTDVFADAFLVLKNNPANFIPHPSVSGGTNFADDNGDYWTSYTGDINVGEGYIVRPQDGYSDPANEAYFMTYSKGTLNNGSITKDVFYNNPTDNPQGTPNALSNPYPSAMSALAFINANPLVNEVYFWEHLTPPSSSIPGSNSINFSMDDISLYNTEGGTKATNDPGTSTEPNGVISTGQGFTFRTQATGSISFTNAMRLTSGNTTLRSANDLEKDRIWVNLKSIDYGKESQTLISFNPNADGGINPGSDSDRIGTSISFYTYHAETNSELGIQAVGSFNPEMKFSLGFETLIKEDTEYEISIDKMEGNLIDNVKVFLYDSQESITTELTKTNYIFSSNSTHDNTRFTLFFVPENVLGPNDENFSPVVIFPNPTKEFITIVSRQAPLESIEIYDLRGRLMQQDIDGDDILETDLNLARLKTGVYFVHVILDGSTIVKKIIKN